MQVSTPRQRALVRERPAARPVMYQSWRNLLFLQWDWDAAEIRRTLPSGLYVDEYEGRCLVGVVPFDMCRVPPRFLPPLPGLSAFLELNLRTYVHDARCFPGVWFYSLDANQRVAVNLARTLFSLPYHRAEMKIANDGEDKALEFTSARVKDPERQDRYRNMAVGPTKCAEPGSLEYFLLERYVLFANTTTGLRALTPKNSRVESSSS